MERRDRSSIVLTMIVLAAIGWLTLRSSPEDTELVARSPFLCIYPCGVEGLRDAVLNVLLFVPLGAALAGWLSGWRLWLTPIAVTLLIEFVQCQWLVGRDASIRDVLTNTLGAALGILLARHRRTILHPAAPLAARLAVLAALVWFAVVGGTALAMRRDLPETTYWGQWAPVLGQFAIYAGTVLDVKVDGVPLTNGRLHDSSGLRRRLLQDSVLITTTVVSGVAPNDPAPIASVFDELQQEIFVLGQAHGDLILRVRNGLAAAELGGQMVRMPDFPGREPGDTVRITGGIVHNHYLLRAESRAGNLEQRIPFSAGWAWTGLMPFHHQIGPEAPLVTALWLGLLMLPAGYWLGVGSGTPFRLLGLGLVVFLGLAGATSWAGLPVAAWSEWAGSAAGAVLGWALGKRGIRGQPGSR